MSISGFLHSDLEACRCHMQALLKHLSKGNDQVGQEGILQVFFFSCEVPDDEFCHAAHLPKWALLNRVELLSRWALN